MTTRQFLTPLVAAIVLLASSSVSAQYYSQGASTINTHDQAMQALNMRDYRTAYSLFSEMARRGDPDGLFHLGMMHQNGEGVPRDLREAYGRLYLAGKRGHQGAAQQARSLQASMPPAEIAAIQRQVDGRSATRPGSSSARPPAGNRVLRPYRPPVTTPPIRPQD